MRDIYFAEQDRCEQNDKQHQRKYHHRILERKGKADIGKQEHGEGVK